MSVHCYAQTNPARPALVVDRRTYTYAELAAAAGRVATWLRTRTTAREPGRGVRVGILAARSFETYAGIIGTAWAGGAFVPLGLKQPADRLGVILAKTRLDALIADARGAAGGIAPASARACAGRNAGVA